MHDINSLKRRSNALALGLNQRIDDLEVRDYSSKSALQLIALLRSILREVVSEVEALENKKSLLLCCVLLEDFGYFINHLDSASSHEAPQALIRMLESMSSGIRPDEMFIAAPDPEFNYKIVDILPLIRERTVNLFPFKKQKGLYADCKAGINVVLFPRTSRDDVLMHAMFGHELGHSIADDFLLAEESGSPSQYSEGLANASSELDDYIEKEYADLTPLERYAEKQEYLEQIIEVRKRGLQEIISDCVGMLLLGPSALFALHDFLITEPLDLPPDEPEYYPPARSRIRHALAILEDLGSIEAIVNLRGEKAVNACTLSHVDYLRSLTSSTGDVDLLRTEVSLKIAYSWLDESISNAIAFAKSAIGKALYPAQAIKSEVPELLARLRLSLPPNEVGAPPDQKTVDWRSSLTTAWIYLLCGSSMNDKDDHADDGSSKKLAEIQRLTMAAIDYIYIQREYDKNVKGVG